MGFGIGIGISPTLGQGVGGYTFANAEAAALVARFTTPPTNARKLLIDNLVGALKTANVWTKLDAFYVLAAADSQAARRNWIADLYNLTEVNAPTFTADLGYTGNGTTAYLDSGFNPTTAPAAKFVQDSNHLGIWSRTNLDNAGSPSPEIGNAQSRCQRQAAVSGAAQGRPNSAGTVTIATGGFPGHTMYSRTAAGIWEGYAQGVDAGGGTDASTALTSANLYILSSNTGAFGLNQDAAAHWGSGFTAGEAASMFSAIQTYLQAIGAA